MNKINTEALLSGVNIVSVIGKYIDLEKRGSEYYGICPFHDDHKRSLQVNEQKQIYKCFPCGAGGDAIDFLQKMGMDFKEACAELDGNNVYRELNPEKRAAQKKRAQSVHVTPAPRAASKSESRHPYHGAPDRAWVWRDAEGRLVGYTCRFNYENPKDGSPDKNILPLTYRRDGAGKDQGYKYKGFSNPRPLYDLHRLAKYPDKPVLIVEGEKTADAVKKATDSFIVTTWLGGSSAIDKTDWAPLEGRTVYFWNDNDAQGMAAMLHIESLISKAARIGKFIYLSKKLPYGWDGADKEWGEGELDAFFKKNFKPKPAPNVKSLPAWIYKTHGAPVEAWRVEQIEKDDIYYMGRFEKHEGFTIFKDTSGDKTPEENEIAWGMKPAEKPEPDPEPTPDEDNYNSGPPSEPPVTDDGPLQDVKGYRAHFKILGFDKTENGTQAFYFYAKHPNTTIRLTTASMSLANLIQLAPVSFWEMTFPTKKGSFDVKAGINWLVSASNTVGPFKDKYIRGRGAWMDEGRVVLHSGDRLIVDGEELPLGVMNTRYIYEASEPLSFSTDNALNTEEAYKLVKLAGKLRWERPIAAHLLIGWCVIAPVCGILKWRPHLWLTGGAGSGKTWIMTNIVRKLLGETSLSVQSNTSEAGLRQYLQHDAMPVIFDEAEGETKKATENMDNVMQLMRAASADDGGAMLKGTSTGQAKIFRIRSTFAFSSINVQVTHQSDRGRVTILSLKEVREEDGAKQHFENFLRHYNQVMTEEFIDRLHARTVKMAPVIVRNIETFSNAAAAYFGKQRQGDQLGPLMAGAYSLVSDSVIDYDQAVAYIKDNDWAEEESLSETKDERALIHYILEQIVTVEHKYGTTRRSIGELLLLAANKKTDSMLTSSSAVTQLSRIGIGVDDMRQHFMISNTADYIKKILQDTAWSRNHNKVLLRLLESESVESIRLASGVETRAVKLPISIIS